MNENKYIVLERFTIVKQIMSSILVIFLTLLLFLRWTGFFENTLLSWKEPEINLIVSESDDAIEQKNDQLWINLEFDSHHSNVKEAKIWVDDEAYSQDLIEGKNTYIFRGLTSGSHKIEYNLEWSLFGNKSESHMFDISNVSTFDFDILEDITRTEEEVEIDINREGDFIDINGVSTAGLYYLNSSIGKKISNLSTTQYEKISNGIEIEKGVKILDSLEDKKILGSQDILIKQSNIEDGSNEIEFSEVIVDDLGNTEVMSENTNKRYTMIPMGMSMFQDRIYLVISFPFGAYTYGIPQINNFNAYANDNGDITVNQLVWDRNNYDKSGEEYIQFNLYSSNDGQSTWNPVGSEIITLAKFEGSDSYTYEGILKNEEYFEVPPSFNGVLNYKIEVQIKYGYLSGSLPEVNDTPPKSSNLIEESFIYYSPATIYDYSNSYLAPFYKYSTNDNDEIEQVSVYWNTGEWIDTPDFTSKLSVESRVYDDSEGTYTEWDLFQEMSNLSYLNFDSNSNLDESIIVNGDILNGISVNINEGDVIDLRIKVATEEVDWWDDTTGEFINYIYLPSISNNRAL